MKTLSAAAVFKVSNVDAALKYYITILGFSGDFRFGDYAGVKLGEIAVHLSGHTVHEKPVGAGIVYIFCDEVDAYYAELKRKGAVLKSQPQDEPYGLRDFMAADPDGNQLSFGCEKTPSA